MKEGEFEITNKQELDLSKRLPTDDKCTLFVKADSVHGCTLTNYYAVSAFIRVNHVIFFIVGLVIGLFLAYFGSKIYSITLMLTAFISTIAGIFLLVFGIFGAKQVSTGIMWVILVCSIIIAVCVAYLFYKIKKVFMACLGGITGYMVGLILYNFFLRYIKSNPSVVFWLTIVVCIAIGVVAAWFLEKHLIIFSTSILGSYLIIRASSLVFGSFPSEGEVIDLINRQEYDQLKTVRTILFLKLN